MRGARYEYHAALCQTIEGNLPPFSDADHHAYVRRVPLGVCGLITSWNHPLLIANKKISVALASGNTVVVSRGARLWLLGCLVA